MIYFGKCFGILVDCFSCLILWIGVDNVEIFFLICDYVSCKLWVVGGEFDYVIGLVDYLRNFLL